METRGDSESEQKAETKKSMQILLEGVFDGVRVCIGRDGLRSSQKDASGYKEKCYRRVEGSDDRISIR
ncbi:hypothetical protein PV327_002361 [Microctonus hyperodae]|uniref:Uncharacterized protein n=1 Tax=Microctonus hyperodae TaxID=165561 RepID=A0AA39KP08_MICHY|nr:hypothetical protein PV327_002361 [Microctonus hyperodae]